MEPIDDDDVTPLEILRPEPEPEPEPEPDMPIPSVAVDEVEVAEFSAAAALAGLASRALDQPIADEVAAAVEPVVRERRAQPLVPLDIVIPVVVVIALVVLAISWT